jgi:hypothetical protein
MITMYLLLIYKNIILFKIWNINIITDIYLTVYIKKICDTFSKFARYNSIKIK